MSLLDVLEPRVARILLSYLEEIKAIEIKPMYPEGSEEEWDRLTLAFLRGSLEMVAKPEVNTRPRYRVRYYDRVKSHRGQGVQARTFVDLDKAREFAGQHRLYANPCVVEVL